MSRNSRRVGTKSSVRLECQRKTAGAANRARKSVQGSQRHVRFNYSEYGLTLKQAETARANFTKMFPLLAECITAPKED